MNIRHRLSGVLRISSGLFLLLFLLPEMAFSSHNLFPEYPSIRPNVRFWKGIYSKYSTSQGVIHDSYNLDIIYEVVELEDSWDRRTRRRNKKKIEKTKDKYEKILRKLARGKKAETKEEKRVLSLFGDAPQPPHFKEAAKNIRLQIGQKNVFREGIVRSGAYFDEFKRIINSYGLPEDLAYLPHVESSFNYKAYSKFGAAGIWQFTHSTGKRFMNINYTVDERRDPIRATHAAAKLLKENYAQLESWPLAITAYNYGTNGMMKAKQSKGDYETIFNEYEGRLFKFASRNFYSEFLAARDVAKNATKYFGALTLDPPVQSREVTLQGYMNVDEFMDHLNLDMATFRVLNPGLREPVYRGQKYIPKGYQVRLPERQHVLRLASNIPESLYKESQKRSSFYLVRRGDTAGAIAKMHGNKLQDLILANQLNSRATVYVGQNLRIPKPDEKFLTLASTAKSQVAHIQVAGLEPKLALIEKEPTVPESSPVAPEVFGKNDGIPKKQAAAVEDATASVHRQEKKSLEELNESGREAFTQNNQPLPSADNSTNAPAMSASLQTQQETDNSVESAELTAPTTINPAVIIGNLQIEEVIQKNGKNFGVIRVEAEETLGHYAEWLGVRAQDLRRLNGLRFGQAIRVHQQIKIPLEKITKEGFEEIRYEYHKEMEEDFFAAYRIESIRHYKVRSGDNIWTLCQNEFELPFWLIRKYNADLNFSGLKPDQKLLVPVVEQLS